MKAIIYNSLKNYELSSGDAFENRSAADLANVD